MNRIRPNTTLRVRSRLFGLSAIGIAAAQIAFCFWGPFAFLQKPTLVLFPLYSSGLTAAQLDSVTELVERKLALTNSYAIVSHRFIVEYFVRTDPDFDRAMVRTVDYRTARAIARELGVSRFALAWVANAPGSCELAVSVWDLSDEGALRRGSFVARDLAGLISGVAADGRPFDFRSTLGVETKGIGPTELLVLSLFALQFAVGLLALLRREPDLLVEIAWAASSVLFLFAYIYATNANMDYMQRYVASIGQLRLAESTFAERLHAVARFAPSLLLLGAWWIGRSLFRRSMQPAAAMPGAGPCARAPRGAAASPFARLAARWPLPCTILSALLFGFSFPSPLALDGIGWLAWFALVPLLLVLMSVGPRRALFYGVYFGILQGLIVNYWHGTYDYVTLHLISIAITVEYLAFMAPFIWLLRVSGRWGFLSAPAAWLLFDWGRSLGTLGYPWGLAGATQYRVIPLIQIASATGIWGVDLLVLVANAAIAWTLAGPRRVTLWRLAGRRGPTGFAALGRMLPIGVAAALVAACLVAGTVTAARIRALLADAPDSMTVVLVQPNTDPRKNEYTDNMDRLVELTDAAIARLSRAPDLVAWPEGAFMLDLRTWTAPERSDTYWGGVVRRFLDYQRSLGSWLVTGTQDHGATVEHGRQAAKNFNSSILLDPSGATAGLYHKIHLVPFTEYFPLDKQRFAGLYGMFKKYDISDWGIGDRRVVFDHPKARFSTPICFEDVFPDGVRRYVLAGADLILNLSNDYWSLSPVEGRQHGIFALFRAVENRRPLLRATESGYTLAVDPTGRIAPGAPAPYTDSAFVATVPIARLPLTLYTRWGDWFPALVGALVALFAFGRSIVQLFSTLRRSPEPALLQREHRYTDDREHRAEDFAETGAFLEHDDRDRNDEHGYD